MDADQVNDASSCKQVRLPEPDAENITVLTKELPNEPILPWHHYDSPWLEGEEKDPTEAEHKAKSGLEGEEKDPTKAEHKAKSDKTAAAEEPAEEKTEALLLELKEKIAAEIELLEQTEPPAQSTEPNGNVEEIAELARELASKLDAKQAMTVEELTQLEPESAAAQLEIPLVETSEDLDRER